MGNINISNGGSDREAIIDAVLRLYAGIDTNNVELFTSGVTEDCEFDLSKVSLGGHPMPVLKGLREDVLPKVFHFLEPFGKSHSVTNFRVEKKSPDLAIVSYIIVAQHWRAEDAVQVVLPVHYTLSIRYTSTVVRVDGDLWKIKSTVGEGLWALGDPAVLAN